MNDQKKKEKKKAKKATTASQVDERKGKPSENLAEI